MQHFSRVLLDLTYFVLLLHLVDAFSVKDDFTLITVCNIYEYRETNLICQKCLNPEDSAESNIRSTVYRLQFGQYQADLDLRLVPLYYTIYLHNYVVYFFHQRHIIPV